MTPEGKILVVDDHIDLAENVAEILQMAGYTTVTADSAEAALEIAAAQPIAALITDYRLPGRTGAELIAELRRRGSRMPAVVMSAYTDDDTIETAERAGAIDVLAKPVRLDRLMSLIDGLGGDEALVLIVEDNRALAENLAEVLRGRGVDAVVTTSASEAMAQRGHFRAAIVDFRLPDATGLDVAQRLRARDPAVRVLIVSAYADEVRERAPEADTMDKPVDLGRLLSWVATTLGDGNGQAQRPRR